MKKSSLFLFCIFINIYSAEQPFPIQTLPLDIQNLIAYFLDWRELENESLLTRLNSVTNKNTSLETKNYRFSLDKDTKLLKITNKITQNRSSYNLNPLESKWWHIISFNPVFSNDTLQILIGFEKKRKINKFMNKF